MGKNYKYCLKEMILSSIEKLLQEFHYEITSNMWKLNNSKYMLTKSIDNKLCILIQIYKEFWKNRTKSQTAYLRTIHKVLLDNKSSFDILLAKSDSVTKEYNILIKERIKNNAKVPKFAINNTRIILEDGINI